MTEPKCLIERAEEQRQWLQDMKAAGLTMDTECTVNAFCHMQIIEELLEASARIKELEEDRGEWFGRWSTDTASYTKIIQEQKSEISRLSEIIEGVKNKCRDEAGLFSRRLICKEILEIINKGEKNG